MSFHPRRRWTAWIRWPDDDDGPYHIGLTWSGTEQGRVRLVGVELWAVAPASERVSEGPENDLLADLRGAPELTARLLHDFPLASVAQRTRSQLVVGFEGAPGSELAATPGRYGRDHYEAVAAVYRSAVTQGLEPYAAIRARWPASKSTIAKWVARARHEFGLLPATSRGRAAG